MLHPPPISTSTLRQMQENNFFDKLPGHGSEHTSSSSKVVHAQKIEPMTVSELNQFVITSESQIIEFLCTAKVTGIDQADGWCYIGCSVCSKKLLRETSSFTCVPCNVTNAVAALRYRVTLSVSDSTDTASFLGFDIEMAKLTNILASEASQIVVLMLGLIQSFLRPSLSLWGKHTPSSLS